MFLDTSGLLCLIQRGEAQYEKAVFELLRRNDTKINPQLCVG